MKFAKYTVMVTVLALGVTGGLWAQRPGGMGGMFGSMPSMPGLMNPTVGSGAEYTVTTKGKEMDVASVNLGKEDVDGATGYWMESRVTGGAVDGEMVMKSLVVNSGGQTGIKKMIMQMPGKPPMEMSGMMLGMFQQHQPPSPAAVGGGTAADPRGELVGTESVTVPAGTFVCQHYHKQGQRGPEDVWISTNVTPYALVKMNGPDASMVLKKVLTGETSHIKGEPQPMQFPGMPQH